MEPTHAIHAPGRVNLIGGHIDYHGLPVLPIAIDRGIDLLFRPRDDALVQAVSEGPEYAEASFELSANILPAGDGDWSNYVRGPAQALARDGASRGMDVLVTSTLPAAVGLSSSSALAVATGLAVAAANQISVEKEAFAALMAEAERYTGTQGGGMDQAVSLLGQEGHALHLHFSPLRADPVPVPAGLEFIVAHSLETAEKSGGSREDYNERRQGGEAARRSVADDLGLPPDTPYQDLLGVDDLLSRGSALLHSPEREYFRHVVSEGARVERAVAAIRSGDLIALGELMCGSHESLSGDYGVSTPNLDELVSIAMDVGALGARLTGAGFGGAVIILAPAGRRSAIEGAIAEGFYRPRGIADPGDAGLLFSVRAANGARLERLAE